MKRFLICLLVVCLLLTGAAAEEYVVLCINCEIDGETCCRFTDEAVLTASVELPVGGMILGWRVNGDTVPGEMTPKLTFAANGNTVVEAVIGQGSISLAEGDMDTDDVSDQISPQISDLQAGAVHTEIRVLAIGASLQYLDSAGNAAGDKSTELVFFGESVNPVTGKLTIPGTAECMITADRPHSADIAYWVLNGVRYDFVNTVKSIRITNLTYDLTVEVVYKNGQSLTLNGTEKNERTEEKLVVTSENAKMSFAKGTSGTGREEFNEFDFTEDYRVSSSGQTEKGGLITLKVAADSKTVKAWELNGALMEFDTDKITWFVVRDLDTSMDYAAHGDGTVSTSEKAGNCRVTCRGCTFTGGGYLNAVSGTVPVGTQITLQANGGSGSWKVNGVPRTLRHASGGKVVWETNRNVTLSTVVHSDITVEWTAE